MALVLYTVGQIISNYYRHIDFSCQSRFETKITLREQGGEPYVRFIEIWWQNTKPDVTELYIIICRSRM